MATLDEITKENSDSARRFHASMLNARSLPASSVNWKRSSVCSRAIARARSQGRRPQPKCRPRERRRLLRRDYADAGAARLQSQLAAAATRRASTIRFLPWQPARRSKKSPLHASARARTMSEPRLPGTSAPAASKSAMGSSMPHSRPERSNASQSEAGVVCDARGIMSWRGASRGSMTEYGRSLKRALEAICDWGREHMARTGATVARHGSRRELEPVD
jgi:hypothetical protein